MSRNKFGGSHTIQKLEVLENYLNSFLLVMKYQTFSRVYIDAFAGTGEIQLPDKGELFADVEDLTPVIEGSTQRALGLSIPFDRYIFVEANRLKAAALERKIKGLKPADRIEIARSDANRWLVEFCKKTNWRNTRAVLFLDPFGNQVEWATLVSVARTQAIDMWYLFPAGLGVNRQLGRTGQVLPDHAASLDRIFGPHDWRKAFLKDDPQPDMFGHVGVKKHTDADKITKFMIECLRSEFKGGVVNAWLPLGRGGAHWYSLLFAWANPSENAKVAGKLASAIMSRS